MKYKVNFDSSCQKCFNIGKIMKKNGSLLEAAKFFEFALKLNPKFEESYV